MPCCMSEKLPPSMVRLLTVAAVALRIPVTPPEMSTSRSVSPSMLLVSCIP